VTKDGAGLDRPTAYEPEPDGPDAAGSGPAERGTTEPGTPERGTTEPGTPERGTTEPGTPEPGAARRSVVRWFHRPIALGAVALVLAVSGASTIAYAVTRPDANHPPSVAGAQDVSGGVPVPVLPAAPVAPATPAPTAPPAVATVPPPLPAAPVVPVFPSPTATPSASPTPSSRARTRSASPSPTRPSPPTRTPSPSRTPKASPSRTARPSRTPTPTPTTSTKTLPTPLGSSDPVEVVVRRLGIDRKPIRLGLTKDNALQVPDTAEDLGWYTGGPTPGAMGASVIAGHVSYNKPGVFFRLATLQRGDTVEVRRKDGKTAVFTVSGTRVYPKDKFPTDDVYGFVDRAALRLITCGGDYNAKTRHFDDNVVVYADMTSVRG